MSTFSLEHIILMGITIISFFKAFSLCDVYPYESLQLFASRTEIVNKSGNVGFICNEVKYMY
jgi:hypothetical protein